MRHARRILALIGLFAAGLAALIWLQLSLPDWMGSMVGLAGLGLLLAGIVHLAGRWWPDPVPSRPPRRADPDAPRPVARSARRAVVETVVWTVVGWAVTLALAVWTVTWFQGRWERGPDGPPVWFDAILYVAGTAFFATLSGLAVPHGWRLRRAARRIPAGQEPRWLATVLRPPAATTLVLRAERIDGGGTRIVRVFTTGAFNDLEPGDELILDGSLRRLDWVAVPGFGSTRWVSTTLRQP